MRKKTENSVVERTIKYKGCFEAEFNKLNLIAEEKPGAYDQHRRAPNVSVAIATTK